MSQETDHPDWVKTGAEVLLFNQGRPGAPANLVRSTVMKVTRTTFTVAAADEPRFRFTNRQFGGPGFTVRQGGRDHWGWSRVVVPLDSADAHDEVAREKRAHLEDAGRTAVEVWQRNRTRDNRLAAVRALEAIEGHDPVDPR